MTQLQDKIGRQELIDNILDQINSLPKDKCLTLAINGPWGSGKTFLLGLIEERLVSDEYIVVKYNAWENSFYSDPIISILSCVLDTVEKCIPFAERAKSGAKTALGIASDDLEKHSKKFKNAKTIFGKIKDIINAFIHPIQSGVIDDFRSYEKLLTETKNILKEIAIENKIVFLVDEIDRCLPNDQLKILERMHHVLCVDNCFTIVAINEESIAKTIKTLYGMDGYEYLRKFFDKTYELEPSTENYLKSIFIELQGHFPDDKNRGRACRAIIGAAYNALVLGDKKVLLKTDNRELDRYYQSLCSLCDTYGWEKLKPEILYFVIIALFIRMIVSPTFLNMDIIVEKNKDIKMIDHDYENRGEIRYYDFLKEYIGLDRDNPPQGIGQNFYLRNTNDFILMSVFNEAIYYCQDNKYFNDATIRHFNSEPYIDSNMAKELRKLILQFGGEQKQYE